MANGNDGKTCASNCMLTEVWAAVTRYKELNLNTGYHQPSMDVKRGKGIIPHTTEFSIMVRVAAVVTNVVFRTILHPIYNHYADRKDKMASLKLHLL